jgi:hypothetical protein
MITKMKDKENQTLIRLTHAASDGFAYAQEGPSVMAQS